MAWDGHTERERLGRGGGGVRRHVGDRTLRLEDARLVRGIGTFAGDIDLSGQLWLRVVRAEVAHALLRSVDADLARHHAGVRLVLTGQDVAHLGPIRVENLGYHEDFPMLDSYAQPVLALDRVRYVGEPIAAVVADDPYIAEDAAELVQAEYEELPTVLDPLAACRDDAATLFAELGNEPVTFERRYGQVEEAFARAAHTVSGEFVIGRHSAVTLEPRAFIAHYEEGRDHLTIWGAVHSHDHRRFLAEMFGAPLTRISVQRTDIGGNFGSRGSLFSEHVLAVCASKLLRRPVKWIEDRAEHMVATSHAREQVHHIEGAFTADGHILGLRDEIWHNNGAYLRQAEPLVSDITVGMVCGPYRVPAYHGVIHAVLTNKTPLAAYRAPGRFEGTFARERLLDLAAAELGIDPVELRRINLIPPEELPYEPGIPIVNEQFLLDSGDFPGHLAKAVEAADYDGWREEAKALRAEGRLVGNGIGFLLDKAGLGVYETGGVDVDAAGRIRVLTGGQSVGQGIETVFAQIVADELGVKPSDIDVIHGNTDLIPDGVGSWSSRSTVIGGGAVMQAARSAAAKARRIASRLLEVAADDLVLDGGRVFVAGSPERGLTLWEVAAACDPYRAEELGEEPGLGARAIYYDHHMNYPYGATLAQVEIDPETGAVHVRRLLVSCEAGKAINPLLTEGQLIGAACQGLGGTLLEEFRYDEQGQPLCTSFLNYLLPTATEMPPTDTVVFEDAPTPDNPLGAKGIGEVGIIAVGASVAAAIDDALGRTGAITKLPVTPQKLRELAQQAKLESART